MQRLDHSCLDTALQHHALLPFFDKIRKQIQNAVPHIPSENQGMRMMTVSEKMLFYTESGVKVHVGCLTAGMNRWKRRSQGRLL